MRCPFCSESVRMEARFCPHCTRQVAGNEDWEAQKKFVRITAWAVLAAVVTVGSLLYFG